MQYRLKKLYSVRFTLINLFFLLPILLSAQANIELTVNGATVATTCSDILSGPDIRWGVTVNGGPRVVYPAVAVCFTDPPFTQYSASYDCLDDVPATVEVCFTVFEDDSFLCNLNNLDCQERICDNFAIPPDDTPANHTLSLPAGLSSSGTLDFTITNDRNYIGGLNDFPCDAIDLGLLPSGGQLGDASLSNYNNFCGTNLNEPRPENDGGWFNDHGVWFRFTTSANPSGVINLNAINDPEQRGDTLNIQIAVYESSDGTCTGTFDLVRSWDRGAEFDEQLPLECPKPNTTYFVVVDGRWVFGQGTERGWFGLEIDDNVATEGPDFICDATDMGTVPENGSTAVADQSNFCATRIGERQPSAFVAQRTVWYRFDPPSSGHVQIDVISDLAPPDGNDIDLQIAVFHTADNDCTSRMLEVESVYTYADYDEQLILECLTLGKSYWIMIDGAGRNTAGIFDITVSDAGDLPPQFQTTLDEIICDGDSLVVGDTTFFTTTTFQEIIVASNGCDSLVEGTLMVMPNSDEQIDTTICFGTTISVGTATYTSTGIYETTVPAANGCDSIITTNLVVADELSVTATMTAEASGYLDPDGTAGAVATGGDGNYSYLWSDGQATATATGLLGGQDYCVTVTDGNGCTAEDCVLIFFPSNIFSLVVNDTVDCHGDVDGSLTIFISNGAWPYDFDWENGDGSLSGSGVVATEGGSATIDNLAPGNYSFTITDNFGIASAFGEVVEPDPIVTQLDETLCFGESLSVGSTVYSGSGPINELLVSAKGCDSTVVGDLLILAEISTSLNETLCFGETLTVGSAVYNASGPISEVLTAASGCDSTVTGDLFIHPEVRTDQQITVCAGGSITVGTTIYDSSGQYTEVLTAATGCDSTVNTDFTVLQELVVNTVLSQEASALWVGDGEATALALGGSGNYSYAWSDGQSNMVATGLEGGRNYCVTVTDDIGCSAEACVVILFPSDIRHTIVNDTVDCIGDANGSLVFTAFNGQAPYTYTWQNTINSLNGSGTIATEGGSATLSGLPAGQYAITLTDPWGTAVIAATISDPEPILIDMISENAASCFGFCDGAIEIAARGGTGPYQYRWAQGGNSPALADLCAGIYEVTVGDANGCTATFQLPVEQPAEFIATAVQDRAVLCFGEANGQATVSTNGSPIGWLWDNGEQTATALGLEAGLHQVTVTNQDGCEDITQVLIEEPGFPLSATIAVDNPVSCFGSEDGVLLANPAGGEGYEFLWSNGSTESTATGLTAGWHYLTLEDANGCQFFDSIQLIEPDLISASLATIDVTCWEGEQSGSLWATQTMGGVGPYLYALDGAVFSPIDSFGQLLAGSYDLIIQDAAGCEERFEARIEAPEVVTMSLGKDDTVKLGDSIKIQPNTNNVNLRYLWTSLGAIPCDTCETNYFKPTNTTTYSLTVVDTLTGCSTSDEITITVDKARGVYIPNIFTPNGDGQNDVFTIYADGSVANINSFRIFSRWGELIFESRDGFPNSDEHGWKGIYRGADMDAGVYLYTAEIRFIDDVVRVFKGDVTLVRD
ncbi:MAG: gliding motility-associated C-terminal domain-containing protein [Bacteroidota bacterium]